MPPASCTRDPCQSISSSHSIESASACCTCEWDGASAVVSTCMRGSHSIESASAGCTSGTVWSRHMQSYAIICNQTQSDALRRAQTHLRDRMEPSYAIICNPMQSYAIICHQTHSDAIRRTSGTVWSQWGKERKVWGSVRWLRISPGTPSRRMRVLKSTESSRRGSKPPT